MRATIEVLISSADDIVVVDGDLVLPGVVAHHNPNPKRQDVWLTHVTSGLPLVMGAAQDQVSALVEMLGSLPWNIPAGEIYTSCAHAACAEEAASMVSRSDRQENRLAKDLNGRRSPASGAGIGLKRDVRTKRLLIEAKTTERAVYYAQVTELRHLAVQAFQEGRVPAFIMQIRDHEEVVLMPEDEIFELSGEDPPETITGVPVVGSMGVSEDLVHTVINGQAVRYCVGDIPYILMGYEAFITLVKP